MLLHSEFRTNEGQQFFGNTFPNSTLAAAGCWSLLGWLWALTPEFTAGRRKTFARCNSPGLYSRHYRLHNHCTTELLKGRLLDHTVISRTQAPSPCSCSSVRKMSRAPEQTPGRNAQKQSHQETKITKIAMNRPPPQPKKCHHTDLLEILESEAD